MPTTPPTITASPTPPDPTDRGTYNSRAYAWMTWLKDAVTQIYNVAVNAYDNAVTASNAATTATSAVSGIGSSVTAAATSASNAAASESAALASLNAFKGTYYGAYASDPSLDPLGAAKTVGDLYYNTAVPEMRVWNGSAWVATYLPAGAYATLTGVQNLTNKTLTDAIASGSFLLTSGTGGIGYGTGAGSTATQPTSKSTSVTLNKLTGKITMHNAALAANTAVTFICLNSTVTAGCTVSVSLVGGYAGLLSDYLVTTYTEAGLIGFGVRNMTGGSLSDALQIQFNVIKGATA